MLRNIHTSLDMNSNQNITLSFGCVSRTERIRRKHFEFKNVPTTIKTPRRLVETRHDDSSGVRPNEIFPKRNYRPRLVSCDLNCAQTVTI